jgi:cytochrome P450
MSLAPSLAFVLFRGADARQGVEPALVIPLAVLALLLLSRLPGLISALALQLARIRELASRLWRLLLALVAALVPPDGTPIPSPGPIGSGGGAAPWPGTDRRARLRRALARHLSPSLLLSLLRLVLPRFWLPGSLWRRMVHPDSFGSAFPIGGMLWLSRNVDVREVLERPDSFLVVYGPRMRGVTLPLDPPPADDAAVPEQERGNFLLGMQDTPRYLRDISNMRLAFRREDAERCGLLAGQTAAAALERAIAERRRLDPAATLLRLDPPVDLVLPVVESLIRDYFGIPVPLSCPDPAAAPATDPAADPGDQAGPVDPAAAVVDAQQSWLAVLFNHIFYDLKGDSSRDACRRDAPLVRAALRQIIRRRRLALAAGEAPEADDVLSRCLRLQRSGTPGLDDETLRVNVTGFLVGAMAPLINASCQVIDLLLERPEALALAQDAARRRDPDRLRGCVIEALRFSPGDPVIYRWTAEDTWLGEGSSRCRVPRGTLVMAWNSSAMFDPALVEAPWQFRPDREPGSYLHWGLGQHTCAGAYINQAAIPAMLAPLLRLEGLVRAPGDAGQPVKDGPDGITIRHLELLIPAAAGPATPLP